MADPVTAALRTAHDMNLASLAVSKDFPELKDPLRIGIGITTGEAALGNVGTGTVRDYTALGDSVNLAFRLESASKELKTDILLDLDSYKHLPKELWKDSLQSIMVKGKEKPLTVCAVTFDELGVWLSGPLTSDGNGEEGSG